MSSEADTTDHTDWKRISVLAAGGVTLTIGGAFLKWGYLQSVIANLGTTLILFGYLWVAERRLAKQIHVLSNPRTLSEAQNRVRDVLRTSPTPAGRVESYDRLIRTCLAGTSSKIMQAGFKQRRPSTAGASVELYDQGTMSITWLLQQTSETLRHRITFPDGTAEVTEPVDVRSRLSVEDLRAALYQFEDQVFDGLLMIINRMGPERRPTSTPAVDRDHVSRAAWRR